MPVAFLVDLSLLLAAILAALLGALLLMIGLYDLVMSYWHDDRERWITAVTSGVCGLVLVGGGYLLQLGI